MRLNLARFYKFGLTAVMCGAFLLMPELALAQTGAPNEALQNFSQIAASLVHIISAVAIMIVQFMPSLWGSELITGPEVTEAYRFMWVYVRNLCNIAFVGMIMFVAIANMVTSGKGIKDWSIKSKLGPIILGLVAINFSMLIVRVMVDAVHVGTVALLAIADPVIEARGVENVSDFYARSVDTETFVPCEAGSGGNCKTIHEIVNNTFCPSGDTSEGTCLFKLKETSAIAGEAESMTAPEKRNIMLAFGTFFMKLESLPQLSAGTNSLVGLLDSTVFSIVFGLAYLLALIAMFIVLLVRVVMMWLFIVISPVIVMSWTLGFSIGKVGDQFWAYLLVPVKAAAALAFGFVMIAAMEGMLLPNSVFVNVIEPGPPLIKFWGPEEFGGWHMIWKILTVVLFWKVVFDVALSGLDGVSGITDKIKGFGTEAGKFTLAAAGDQVSIPGINTEGGGLTLTDVLGGRASPTNFMRNMRNKFQQPGSTSWGDASQNALGAGTVQSDVKTALNNLGAGASPTVARDRFTQKFTTDQLVTGYVNANKDTKEGIVEAIIRANGNNNRENLNADMSTSKFEAALKRMEDKNTDLFKASETAPDPAPTTPAAPGPVTVNAGGTAVTVNSANDVTIGTENNTTKTDILAGLKPLTIGDTQLQQILDTLKSGNDDWEGISDLAGFKSAISSS